VHISKANPKEEKPLVVVAAQTAISISHPGARAIVAKFDGHHTANQISEELKAPIDVVENVINRLLSAQLLDIKNSRIKLLNRFQSPIAERAAQTQDQSNDAFFRQLQLRMAPELSQTTWIENIVDGGVEILSARQLFGVEIYGNNRVATLIYAGLLASGVSNTKFSLASRSNNQSIGDSDLGTGVLRINDFGLGYKSRVEELAREWSLFPTARKVGTEKGELPISARNLRVIVGNFQPELAQQLMRDKLDHFFVGEIMGGAALCGPLVIPEQTPCWQCLMLSRSEQLGVEELIPLNPLNDEPPVSIAYQIAGLAIASILRCLLIHENKRNAHQGIKGENLMKNLFKTIAVAEVQLQQKLAHMHDQFFDRLKNDRGDVPGWVLVVLMTTGLVTAIWTIAAPRLSAILKNSLDSMNGIR